MNISMQAEHAGERIMVAAVAVYGDNAVFALSKLVAALSEGTELDLTHGIQEARRLLNAGSSAVADSITDSNKS